MSGTDHRNKPPKKGSDRSGKSSPTPVKRDDPKLDDVEDGDIATPKLDHTGDDDEPL